MHTGHHWSPVNVCVIHIFFLLFLNFIYFLACTCSPLGVKADKFEPNLPPLTLTHYEYLLHNLSVIQLPIHFYNVQDSIVFSCTKDLRSPCELNAITSPSTARCPRPEPKGQERWTQMTHAGGRPGEKKRRKSASKK
jgi:hypothetical protein